MPTINPLAEITTQQQKQQKQHNQQQHPTPIQSSIVLSNLIPLLLVSLYIIYISYRLRRRRRSSAEKKSKVWTCFFPCWEGRYRKGRRGQWRKGGYRNIIGDDDAGVVEADGGMEMEMDMDNDVSTDQDGEDTETENSEEYSGISQQETSSAFSREQSYELLSQSLSDRQYLDLDNLDHLSNTGLGMSRFFNPTTSRLYENILLEPETDVGSWETSRREVHEAVGFMGWVHGVVDRLVDGAARWVGG
ncbi:hypothetical protein FQN51_007901 [Onygenales sp. PD_10]|nr:hypothetical protein FQN51_007901 [Onygenales sp. PD_10]